MTRIEVTSQVGADGVLRLELPVGRTEANRRVKVVVEDVTPDAKARPRTQEEWERFVDRMAGGTTDPTFHRHEQIQFREGEPLE